MCRYQTLSLHIGFAGFSEANTQASGLLPTSSIHSLQLVGCLWRNGDGAGRGVGLRRVDVAPVEALIDARDSLQSGAMWRRCRARISPGRMPQKIARCAMTRSRGSRR